MGRTGTKGEHGANGHLDSREFALAGLGENQEFVELLRTERVQTIHTQEATLEQIFIRVTGRKLVGPD